MLLASRQDVTLTILPTNQAVADIEAALPDDIHAGIGNIAAIANAR